MFKKFFQRKPKVSDKDRQLERIEALDSSSPQHLSQLLELAKTDPDPNIRSAAASRIGLRDCLAGLLKDEKDPSVRSHLVTLLFRQCSDDDAVEIATNLLRHAEHDQARIALLTDVQQPAAATFIAARIKDPKALIQTAIEHKIARVRLAAAQQLHEEHQLLELSHKARDKSVNQWVRAQLKLIKDQRQRDNAEQAQLSKLLQDCQQLLRSENPLDYRKRIDRLQTLLDERRSQTNDEQLSQIQILLSQCCDKATAFESAAELRAQTEDHPQEPTHVAEPAPVDTDPTVAARERLNAPLKAIIEASDATTSEAIQSLLDASLTEWQSLGEDQPNHAFHANVACLKDAAISQQYLAENDATLSALSATPVVDDADEKDLQELRDNIREYLDVLRWPSRWQVPPTLQALRDTERHIHQIQRDRREKSRKQAQQLDKKIHRLGDALRRKNLRSANTLHREISEALVKIAPHEQRKLQQHLDKHLPALEKMLDWHDYSARPKKEELCEQMEAMIDREQAPEARAEAVKQLRSQWRVVTAANVQKDDPLWTRFNDAANKAYAPCEPYFEKLNQRKRDNLSQRQRLTDELEQLLASVDWTQPPMDMLDKVLRTARAEWKQYSPVHFSEAKSCQKRFDTAMDKVHAAIKSQRRANAAIREQLIARAKSLSELNDTEQAVAQALKIQNEWKAVGPVEPREQRKQWRVFRQQMDAVFARRQTERDANNAEIDIQKEQVNSLVEQLEAIADKPAEQLADSAEESQRLQQLINDAIDALPKRLQTSLSRRMHASLDTIAVKQRDLPVRRRAASYQALADLADQCHRNEMAVLAGEQTEPVDLTNSQWQNLMQSRVDSHQNGAGMRAELEANLNTLERLAIEAEILSDVDTPEAYRGQRRAFQLDMLESGGSSTDGREPEEKFFELLQHWYAVGAVEAADLQSLTHRLQLASIPFAKLLDTESPES